MSAVKVNMVLTGINKGKSGVFGKYKFLNGVCQLTGDAVNVQHAINYLARTYQAYPEGSDDLARAQKLYESKEEDNGDSDEPEEDAGSRRPEQVQGESGASGQKASELRNDAEQQSGSSTDAGAANGSGSEGSGQDAVVNAENPKLLSALKQLDADNDEHWRTDGKPTMDAVSNFYEAGDLTRQDVEKAWPGLNRDVMRKNQEAEENSAEDVV